MKVYRLDNMKDGWFMGNFEPSAVHDEHVEVAWKVHRRGDDWPAHYQRVAKEINVLVKGEMIVQDLLMTTGDIFVVEPGEVVKPDFLTDCELVVVKVPSLPADKVEVPQ